MIDLKAERLKVQLEITEGREAWTQFDSLVGKVLSVPRSVVFEARG